MSDFVDDLSDQLLEIMKDLKEDAESFENLGICYEEKAFHDILIKVRDDIKNQLRRDLVVLLHNNGYPPRWNNDIFEQVLEQAENFKKSAKQ